MSVIDRNTGASVFSVFRSVIIGLIEYNLRIFLVQLSFNK